MIFVNQKVEWKFHPDFELTKLNVISRVTLTYLITYVDPNHPDLATRSIDKIDRVARSESELQLRQPFSCTYFGRPCHISFPTPKLARLLSIGASGREPARICSGAIMRTSCRSSTLESESWLDILTKSQYLPFPVERF